MKNPPPQYSQVLFDANPIIYYCFYVQIKIRGSKVVLKVLELTDKAQILTKSFLDQNIDIITLELIMAEIQRKGLAKIVDEYCNDPKNRNLFGWKRLGDAGRLSIQERVKRKLQKLLEKSWFSVIEYEPSRDDIETVKRFYLSLDGTPTMMEHLKRKGTTSPVPSYEDMVLLCYSADYNVPVVTNDSDLTDFSDELSKNNICFGIINLSNPNI
ncbi:MAG: hypothetical protein FJ150_04355 [Euryarchaeota archaeon]|nr:hypothetical protein [Euryarchaeota archaeon]